MVGSGRLLRRGRSNDRGLIAGNSQLQLSNMSAARGMSNESGDPGAPINLRTTRPMEVETDVLFPATGQAKPPVKVWSFSATDLGVGSALASIVSEATALIEIMPLRPRSRQNTEGAGFSTPPGKRAPASIRRWLIFLAVLLIGIFLFRPIETHLRVMSVVLRFSSPQSTGFGVRFAQRPFREDTGIAQTAWGPLKYRLYTPLDATHCGGIVLVHGIHWLGIEEPRLISFSRALAAAGVEVMTPELHDLADYRVTLHTSDVIGYSADFLSAHMHRPKVGVIGLSFAGGLALLAASKPDYAAKMGFVLAIGAHDDLARVARFLATDIVEMPDGSTTFFKAHEYGALVVAYSHVEDFFPMADVTTAQEALRLWLREMPDEARAAARRLTPQGREKFEQILYHRDQLKEELLRSIRLHANEMAAASPSGQLQNLGVPVYLLHGAADNVIPPSETLWISHEIPKKKLRAVLISPAIIHADVEEKISFLQQWELVNFLAHVLKDIDQLGAP